MRKSIEYVEATDTITTEGNASKFMTGPAKMDQVGT